MFKQDLSKFSQSDNLKRGRVIVPHQNKEKLKQRYSMMVEAYQSRKLRMLQEVRHYQTHIEFRERSLGNMSKNQSSRWRKMQSKTLFVSLMRRFVTGKRHYGVNANERVLNAIEKNKVVNKKNRFIIYPDGFLLKVHTLMILIIMVYLVIFYPLDFAFGLDEEHRLFRNISYFIYIYFSIDIIIGFLSAYQDREMKVIDDHRRVALNYLKTWFFLDFIATIPIHLMFDYNSAQYKGILKIPRLIRILNSVFQSGGSHKQSNSMWNKLSRSLFSSANTFYAMKSLFITFLFVHIAACIWVYLIELNHVNWYDK